MSDYGAPTPLTREEESTVVQPLYPEEVTYVQEGFRHRYDELKKELEPLAVAAERLLKEDVLANTMNTTLIGNLEPTARSRVDMRLWACITVFQQKYHVDVGVDQECTVRGGRLSSALLGYMVGRKVGDPRTRLWIAEGTKAYIETKKVGAIDYSWDRTGGDNLRWLGQLAAGMDPLLAESPPGECHVGCVTDGVFMLFAYLTEERGTLHTFKVIAGEHNVLLHILMVLYFAMIGRVPVTPEMVEPEPAPRLSHRALNLHNSEHE